MTIYVSEMPKNCKECPLYRSGKLKIQKHGRYVDADTCVLGNFYKFQEIDTCPLQTTQFLKHQVRVKVVEEIRERLKKANFEIMSSIGLYSHTDNFLYQVVRGETNND